MVHATFLTVNFEHPHLGCLNMAVEEEDLFIFDIPPLPDTELRLLEQIQELQDTIDALRSNAAALSSYVDRTHISANNICSTLHQKLRIS
jgi:hypothetical protein